MCDVETPGDVRFQNKKFFVGGVVTLRATCLAPSSLEGRDPVTVYHKCRRFGGGVFSYG